MKGFEVSETRDRLIEMLDKCQYVYQVSKVRHGNLDVDKRNDQIMNTVNFQCFIPYFFA